jgi:hypothetical protein
LKTVRSFFLLPFNFFLFLVYLSASILTLSIAAQQRGGSDEVAALLARIGERVERYYARAQSVMCLETVRLQPVASDFGPAGRARVLVYELRVAWDPAPSADVPPEPTVTRVIRTVDGRPPRPGDEPGCMDPQAIASEPLAMFLAGRRQEQVFSWVGTGRTDRRATVMLDYKTLAPAPPDIKVRGECFSVSSAATQGRIWVDSASEDIVRLDVRLVRAVEIPIPRELVLKSGVGWLNFERADSSIRYRRVTFHDPDETVMLPDSVETLTIIRGAAVSRLRETHTFSKYQRFLTDVRIVQDPAAPQ